MRFPLRRRASAPDLATDIDPAPATHRDYLRRHREVEGWIEHATAHIIAYLIALQSANGIRGNMMEIGVHHGRSFILLALGCREAECAFAVDLFEQQELNTSRSGIGDRTRMTENLARFAPAARCVLITADSSRLGRSFSREHSGLRFVSIDGGHSRDTTRHDLFLAQRMLGPAGIVALDDIYRSDWSGVTAGLHEYYRRGGNLVPVALVPNKALFAASAPAAVAYRQKLVAAFPQLCEDTRRQEFFRFDNVLVLNNDETLGD
jgi:hypothetical protein